MTADRYLKGILTIIALELGWIALTLGAQPIAAQRGDAAAQRAATPTPVVITGIQIEDRRAFLPVGVMGQYGSIPAGVNLNPPRTVVEQGQEPLRTYVDTSRAPLRVDLPVPIVVHVEPGSRPIRTEEVPFTPRALPGQ